MHEDGKAWTANEIHLWKVKELKAWALNMKAVNGATMTVHAGASGSIHRRTWPASFKLASEEHVTFNKNYKWVETEPVKLLRRKS